MFGHHFLTRQGSDANLTSKVIQLTLLVLSLITALCLNGLVSLTLLKKRKLMMSENIFVLSLTASNFINALFSFPMLIGAAPTESWSWGLAVCKISAFLQLLLAVNGNLTMAMIAYERYQTTARPKYNQRKNLWSLFMVIGGWTLSTLIASAPLLGWSTFAYHPSLFVCSISWKLHPTYAFVFFLTVVLIPFLVVSFCYIRIYLVSRFQQSRIAYQRPLSSPSNDLNEFEDPLLRCSPTKLPCMVITYSNPSMATNAILVIFSYIICWTAMFVWTLAEIFDHSSSALSFTSYLINSMIAITNPIAYGFMDKSIQEDIRKLVCRKRKTKNRQNAVA